MFDSHKKISPEDSSLSDQEVEAVEKLLNGLQASMSPSAEFTARMQKRLERHHVLMREMESGKGSGSVAPAGAIPAGASRGFFSFMGSHVYSVVTAFVFVLFTGGLSTFAYTSDSVTNGSPLYPLKRGIESIEQNFASTPVTQAEYHMKILSRRLAESRFLTMRGIVDEPTNQEVSLVVNNGIRAIQNIDQVNDRNQLFDRITTLIHDEESSIYATAGIPVPVDTPVIREVISVPTPTIAPAATVSAEPTIITTPREALTASPVSPSLNESRTTLSVENQDRKNSQTSPESLPVISRSKNESDTRENGENKKELRSENTRDSRGKKTESQPAPIQAQPVGTPLPAPSIEVPDRENISVSLHVRPEVLNALQKNTQHLRQIEIRVTEMRRGK